MKIRLSGYPANGQPAMPSFSFHMHNKPTHICYLGRAATMVRLYLDGLFWSLVWGYRSSGNAAQVFQKRGGILPHIDARASATVSTGAAESRVVGSIPAILFGIHIGTLTDEKFHDVIPSPEGGAMKRSHPAVIFGLDITSGLQQQIQRSDCPLFDIFSDVPSPRVRIDRADTRGGQYWRNAAILWQVRIAALLQHHLNSWCIESFGCTQQRAGPDGQHTVYAAIGANVAIRWQKLELDIRIAAGIEEHRDDLQTRGVIQ